MRNDNKYGWSGFLYKLFMSKVVIRSALHTLKKFQIINGIAVFKYNFIVKCFDKRSF